MKVDLSGGIILVNKPRGMTSFGVVSRLRKLTGIKRIGHCGTLDPFAEGLLPVCIGRATSAVKFMEGYDKEYRCEIRFGRSTDTMDTEGKTVDEYELGQEELNRMQISGFDKLTAIVNSLPGEILQTPPMFSAVKIDGRPLYSYARNGQTVERKARPIRIFCAELENVDCIPEQLYFSATIRIQCSKGTYIRVIADSIGNDLGIPAHAQKLWRTRCGPYDLSQAQDIEQMFDWSRSLPDQTAFVKLMSEKNILLPVETAFAGFRSVSLSDVDGTRLIQGQQLRIDEYLSDSESGSDYIDNSVIVYAKSRMIAIGLVLANEDKSVWLKTERVFIDLEDFRSISTDYSTM